MRSLFELIPKYREDVMIVPIIAFVAFVVTFFLYLFLNKRKIIKYIPGFLGLIAGFIILWQGYSNILSSAGLDLIELSIKVFVFAFANIGFSIALDLIDSLIGIFRKKDKKKVKKEKVKKDKNKAIKAEKENQILIDKPEDISKLKVKKG